MINKYFLMVPLPVIAGSSLARRPVVAVMFSTRHQRRNLAEGGAGQFFLSMVQASDHRFACENDSAWRRCLFRHRHRGARMLVGYEQHLFSAEWYRHLEFVFAHHRFDVHAMPLSASFAHPTVKSRRSAVCATS